MYVTPNTNVDFYWTRFKKVKAAHKTKYSISFGYKTWAVTSITIIFHWISINKLAERKSDTSQSQICSPGQRLKAGFLGDCIFLSLIHI